MGESLPGSGGACSGGPIADDALRDRRYKLRRVASNHLPDARPKFIEEFVPTPLPIVEPKFLAVSELERAQ